MKLRELIHKISGAGLAFIAIDGYRITLLNDQITKDTLENLKNKSEKLEELISKAENNLEVSNTVKDNVKKLGNDLTIKLEDILKNLNDAKQLNDTANSSIMRAIQSEADKGIPQDQSSVVKLLVEKLNSTTDKINEISTANLQDSINNINKTTKNLEDLINENSHSFINIGDKIQSFQEYINTLSAVELCSLIHIIFSLLILYSLFNMFTILLGNRIIDYFKLEIKFPRIAKYLKYRAALQKANIYFNCIFIIFAFFTPLYIDICVFLGLKF